MSASGIIELNNNNNEDDDIVISSGGNSIVDNCNYTACVGDDNADTKDNLRKCFICRDKENVEEEEDAQEDCKICHNINLYHSKSKTKKNERDDDDSQMSDRNGNAGIDDDVVVDIPFPGPCLVKRNHIYGNYVVAVRTIEPGEIIISERPFNVGPYSPPDVLPLCLSCFKDIGLSAKCSKCRWPVCGEKCEKFHLHADNECPIFSAQNVKSKVQLSEYFSVEAIRALLLRKKNPSAWKRIMEFEPHINSRAADYKAKATTDFIIDFIMNKCNMGEDFSSETIDHVVGVLSINTFWAFQDLKRYASCLFDKSTLFAHDCDPNTHRKLVFLDEAKTKEDLNDPAIISEIALQVVASRTIHAGEMITIRYINLNQSYLERREELRETFYFDCTCSRCLRELIDDDNNDNELEENMSKLEVSIN